MPEVTHNPAQGIVIGVGRVDLLERVGRLWRGDWSGHSFNGQDGQRWIDTALHGDADDLRAVDVELARLEDAR